VPDQSTVKIPRKTAARDPQHDPETADVMVGAKHKRALTYDASSEIVRAVHAPLVIGLSYETIWRRRRAGDFPPAIRLGDNSVGFRRRDLHAWLDSKQVGPTYAPRRYEMRGRR
jgi:prophage regulatory protein